MTENFTPVKAGGQRPRLSKEEYAEKKRAEKDAVYQPCLLYTSDAADE